MKAYRVCRGQWCVPGLQGNWTRKQADKVERIVARTVKSFVWTCPKRRIVALESVVGFAYNGFDDAKDLALAVKAMTREALDAAIYAEKDRLAG